MGTIIKWALIGLVLYIVVVISTAFLTGYIKTLDLYNPPCCEEARKLPVQDGFKQEN